MSDETCSYYHVGRTGDKNHFLVKTICKQLDKIGVTYTIQSKEHFCSLSPASIFINFDKEQNREWIEENIHLCYIPENISEYGYEVKITSGNLIDCDNWLVETYGFMEVDWTADFGSDFNKYHFKKVEDAMAFKLMFA